MTNYWGLQIGKPSLTCCVPVLLRVSRRFNQECSEVGGITVH